MVAGYGFNDGGQTVVDLWWWWWWLGTCGGGGRAHVFDGGGDIQPDSCVQNNTLAILRTTFWARCITQASLMFFSPLNYAFPFKLIISLTKHGFQVLFNPTQSSEA